MTRAVVFLAAAMVAASLGLLAQDTSGAISNSNQERNNMQQRYYSDRMLEYIGFRWILSYRRPRHYLRVVRKYRQFTQPYLATR